MSVCYLNGEFLDLKDAKISPLDRGFLFGDSIYEVFAAYDKKAFRICLLYTSDAADES